MRPLILILLLILAPPAIAENVAIQLEASPAEVAVGQAVSLVVRPPDRMTVYRYEGMQLSNGATACNDPIRIAGDHPKAIWTPSKSGLYQLNVTGSQRGLQSGPPSRATATVKVNPRKVNVGMINPEPGRVVVTASPVQGEAGLPIPATYKWSVTMKNAMPSPGHPPLQSYNQQTGVPMVVFNVPGTPWLANVHVSRGTPCSVIATGLRPPNQ